MSKKKKVEDDCDLSTFEGCLKNLLKPPNKEEDAGCILAAYEEIYAKYCKSHLNRLIEAFHSETGWNAQEILLLIASSGLKKAFPLYVANLNHELPEMRKIAAGGLAYIGDKQSLDALRSAYDSIEFESEEETAEFRQMIAKALWGD